MSDLTEETYRALRREVEIVSVEAQRAKGALDELLGRLNSEFNCNTLEEAETLLKTLTAQQEKAEATLNKSLKAYEKKWKEGNEVGGEE